MSEPNHYPCDCGSQDYRHKYWCHSHWIEDPRDYMYELPEPNNELGGFYHPVEDKEMPETIVHYPLSDKSKGFFLFEAKEEE